MLSREAADCAGCPEKRSAFQKWSCAHCPEFRLDSIAPETWRLLELRRLRLAHFPFAPDDLDYGSWLLLAGLEEKIEAERKKNELQMILLRKEIGHAG